MGLDAAGECEAGGVYGIRAIIIRQREECPRGQRQVVDSTNGL